MKRGTMFIDWKTQYYKDILQSDLHIELNSNQITTWQSTSKLYLDMQNAKNSQDSFGEEPVGRLYWRGKLVRILLD